KLIARIIAKPVIDSVAGDPGEASHMAAKSATAATTSTPAVAFLHIGQGGFFDRARLRSALENARVAVICLSCATKVND
ncbi:MAG: hypothetical protein LJE70_18655, partial [Chromatiaceae bacterium]|nr:hypothetical protein [Chromatiaceae bacterium]